MANKKEDHDSVVISIDARILRNLGTYGGTAVLFGGILLGTNINLATILNGEAAHGGNCTIDAAEIVQMREEYRRDISRIAASADASARASRETQAALRSLEIAIREAER